MVRKLSKAALIGGGVAVAVYTALCAWLVWAWFFTANDGGAVTMLYMSALPASLIADAITKAVALQSMWVRDNMFLVAFPLVYVCGLIQYSILGIVIGVIGQKIIALCRSETTYTKKPTN